MKKGMIILGFVVLMTFVLIESSFVVAETSSCSKDSDCKVKFSNCGCANVCILKSNEGNVDCARACLIEESNISIKSCKCENNQCVGVNEIICGNGVCEGGKDGEGAILCVDPGIYPNGTMMGGGGCNMVCLQDCNETLPGEGKVKILPETASLRARERLGELGFNVLLKEVGIPTPGDKVSPTKFIYEVSALKEGKMFGLFKVKGKVSVDVDAETGEVLKVHKPWWTFLASGIDKIDKKESCGDGICQEDEYGPYVCHDNICPETNKSKKYCSEDCPAKI